MTISRNRSAEAVDVRVEDLHKSFGSQKVLKGVSLEVKPGEIFVLMGSSGSGKSVLLKHIVGLEQADRGTVTIGGHNAADPATRDAISTAMVFQAGALFNSMTVFDNLALFLREHRLCSPSEIRQRVEAAMEALGIKDAAKKLPATLSGGMRKRVAVARAIVMQPQVILYDEPTSELDPVTGATVAELISQVRHDTGATSFVVTHDRDLALGIADRIALLAHGELIFVGTPDEVRNTTDETLRSFMNPQVKAVPARS